MPRFFAYKREGNDMHEAEKSRVVIQAIVSRSDELSQVGKDVRKFMRDIKKEVNDDDVGFDVQIAINPQGTVEQNREYAEDRLIGFRYAEGE